MGSSSRKSSKKLDARAKQGVLLNSISHGKYRVLFVEYRKVIVCRQLQVVEGVFPIKNGNGESYKHGKKRLTKSSMTR